MTEENLNANIKMSKRIKRLEIAVIVLCFLFVVSVSTSIWSAMQIRTMASSLPSYKELKEDIKTLNAVYKISVDKAPKVYNYTKAKTIQGYEYGKEKTNALIDFFKEKTKEDKKK